MKNIYLILFASLACITESRAQSTQNTIDSLQSLLITEINDTTRVKILNDLSAYYIMADKYDVASVAANEALRISEKIDYEAGIASAYRKLGVNFIQTGNYPLALDYLLKSLRINEKLGNQEEIFKLNNNIGNMYYSQGNYSTALTYFYKAYVYKKNDGLTNANIGNGYLMQGKFKPSLKFLNTALKIYIKENNKNGESDMLNNIGSMYEYKNKIDSAFLYYTKSLKIKEELNDLQGQADILGGLGDLFLKKNDLKLALQYQLKSLEISNKIGYLLGSQQTEKQLSNIYERMGEKEKSYFHYKNYILIRDSLYNEEKTRQTVQAEMNFDFDKKRAIDEALHNEELKHQYIQRNIFIVGFIIILIFSGFLYRIYKKTQKQNIIIENQKKILEEHQQEILDNLNYSSKLQRAMLPSSDYINNLFPNNLVTFLPRDTVSGDFFFALNNEKGKYWGVGDATGHGISGSLTASLANSLLNEIISERKIESPNLILNTLRTEIIKSLNQTGADEERKDGVDIALLKINDMKLECACANNSIYIIRNKNIIELKANRFPVGKYITEEPFTLHQFDLQPSDLIFAFSDGYSDQFGGPKNKKLMSKHFKEWLIELSDLEISQIKFNLEKRFQDWKGDSTHQTDDVTLFAVRV